MEKTPASKSMAQEFPENHIRQFTFQSIGNIESGQRYQYEAPRQAVFASVEAFLRWNDPGYAACAEDLTGFDRIWLIWVFDRNKTAHWRSKVRVPVPAEHDRYSVFATRSPHRPNPIGISAIELKAITPEGLQLGACDLLDGTAVLDVKPYIPQVDSFPAARAGWRDSVEEDAWQLHWAEKALGQAEFIFQGCGLDLQNFCRVQLSFRPVDATRKRLVFNEELQQWQLHCRTWKIFFLLNEPEHRICIERIASNYSAEDLLPDAPDKYLDKELHRQFLRCFG